jgi:hypothetical protein
MVHLSNRFRKEVKSCAPKMMKILSPVSCPNHPVYPTNEKSHVSSFRTVRNWVPPATSHEEPSDQRSSDQRWPSAVTSLGEKKRMKKANLGLLSGPALHEGKNLCGFSEEEVFVLAGL